MMRNKLQVFKVISCIIIVLTLTLMTQAGAESLPMVQTPPIMLHAYEVLPEGILVGPGYKIKDNVLNDGFINTYEIDSVYGPLKVESTALLMIRINEINALQRMEELKKSKVYKDAFKGALKGPLKTAKGVVTSPVKTVSGTVTGIGRWFSDIGRSVVSSDPHQEGVLKTAIGHAPATRKFAYEFGVDPYTSYEPLQKELKDLAWTATGGGMTVKAAFGAIQDTPGKVVRATGTTAGMRMLIRDKSPAELEKINKKKLKAMGVSDALAKEFLRNPFYNPQEETLLVGALESMRGVRGRDLFIRYASLVNEESVALFMRLRAQMMAGYNVKVAPVKRIVDVNGAPFPQTKDGTVVGLFPLDYVAWTRALWLKHSAASMSLKALPGVTGKELWIEGIVDQVARKVLEANGWKVEDNVGVKFRQ